MRITKESMETLAAIRSGVTHYDTLAKELGIPYSSATGRVRRLVKAGKVQMLTNPKPGFVQAFRLAP